MKLEIELDLNNINYDEINRQIQEKIAALNIKDMYSIESRVENKINNIIQDKVEDAYNDYTKKYWGNKQLTDNGRNLVNTMVREDIEKRIKQTLDDMCENELTNEALRGIIFKMIPVVMTNVLFGKIDATLDMKGYEYYNQTRQLVTDEIRSAINNLSIH